MSGYTPVFNTVFEGSLCGRYPDTAAWMFFLALADWKGEVDKTPEFIATITGMPIDELLGCIERFMQPDPRSRSQADEGRKLTLIDPERNWGWRVVNIRAYRAKASGKDQVEDGRNAAKVKQYKERHRRTPEDTGGHPETPTHTADSYSDSYSDSNKEKTPLTPQGELVIGLTQSAWDRFSTYRREIRKPFKPVSVQAAQRKLAGFGADQSAVVEQSIANGWTGLFPLNHATKPNGTDRRRVIP